MYSAYNWKFAPFDQHCPISPIPQTLETTIVLSGSKALTFLDFTYKWDDVSFSVGVISLSVMSSRFIYVVTNNSILYLWLSNIPFVYIYHDCCIHLSIHCKLSCFHILAVISNTAVNSLWRYTFHLGFFLINTWKWDCWVIWW